MTRFRWLFTALSFAALIGVSAYIVASDWSRGHARLTLPLTAHLLALGALLLEIAARSKKIAWSAKAMGVRLPFATAVRTSLGGDFGASITPARTGAEPARYLILAEAKLAPATVLVILFAEIFLEALSIAVVVAVVGIVFHNAGPVLGALVGVVGVYSTFVLVAAALGLLLSRRASGPPPRWALRLGLHAGRWRVIQRWLRQVRRSVDQVRDVDLAPAGLALLASIVHVAVRLTVLPALVLATVPGVPLEPLALWPFSFLYGVAPLVPAPGGGGAVEVVFRAALGDVIPPQIFAAALLWWRFYTFYAYILLGALAAGRTVLRALKKEREMEEELEHAKP